MKVVFSLLIALVALCVPVNAYAIIPCIKEQILDNEFIDEDTHGRGRLKYRADVTEMAAEPQHEVDGSLTIEDVVSGKRLTIKWAAEADSITLAHASYLAALNVALFAGKTSPTGIRLTRLDLKGDAPFAFDEILRLASLVASSYAISGGGEYTGAVLRVADEIGLPLPNLLARAP